jgi:hypothetical protein
MALVKINYDQIEISDAADRFQRLAGIVRKMAHPASLQECVSDQIFELTIVCYKKHEPCLHGYMFTHARIRASH